MFWLKCEVAVTVLHSVCCQVRAAELGFVEAYSFIVM